MEPAEKQAREDVNIEEDPEPEDRVFRRLLRRQRLESKKLCAKDERSASIKKVSIILQKDEIDRTLEESQVLTECSDAVAEVRQRWRKRNEAKRRLEEFEESPEELQRKCHILAQAVAQSQHLVVYTGAGISTAAKIPDYRGPNGIWTRMQQGKDIGCHDLTQAEPTYTHMALAELYKKNVLKYVVSQNCDGLHLRSGLPRTALSELHGNMYIEVCKNCKPHKELLRPFDVTENTARYSHKTSRKCYSCNQPLLDTIVHFGERGSLQWPLNWAGACKNASKATTILCLGSSLKVLKKYPWLWQMDKPARKRPNLYIVNLQWTPKDDVANVKIHGKCDAVMKTVMDLLDIHVPSYDKCKDPIFAHSTLLCDLELHTTTQPSLKSDEATDTIDENGDLAVKKEDEDDDDDELDCKPNDLSTTITTTITTQTIKKSEVCDNPSNSISNKLPSDDVKPENTTNSPFSIDDILCDSPKRESEVHSSSNNFLLGSFYSNLLQYQLLGAYSYSDFIYYPYQTSFLYPGLHNIISPVEEEEEKEIVKVEPSCDFCHENYKSVDCLFYPKIKAAFVNQQYRYSKLEQKEKPNVCVCCDYSTDEDDLLEVNENKEQNEPAAEQRIQAGWFGKGYKKNKRLKKK